VKDLRIPAAGDTGLAEEDGSPVAIVTRYGSYQMTTRNFDARTRKRSQWGCLGGCLSDQQQGLSLMRDICSTTSDVNVCEKLIMNILK
jgi:hypothetical protein